MKVLHFILYCVASLYALWALYVLIMNLDRARRDGTLRPVARAMGMPILAVGLVLDFVVNQVVLSIVMLEPPREALVTERLKRHIGGTDWRSRIAKWLADNLLDPFDPRGKHV